MIWSERWCETELLTSLILRAVPWIFIEALFLRDDDVLNVLHRQVVAEGVEQHLLQLIQRQLLHVKLQGRIQRSMQGRGHPHAPSWRQLDESEMIKMYTTPSLNPTVKSIIWYHSRAPFSFNGSVLAPLHHCCYLWTSESVCKPAWEHKHGPIKLCKYEQFDGYTN